MRTAVWAIKTAKLAVDCNLFTEEVTKLHSERAHALYKLFEMAMIISPSRLVEPDFFKALKEVSPEDWKSFITVGGMIDFSFPMIDYAIYRAKDEDFRTALEYYRAYKYCDEQLKALASVANSSRKGLTSLKVGGTRVYRDIPANMVVTDKLNYGNKYMKIISLRECVERKPNTFIIDVDIRGCFLKGLAKSVGISENEIIKREYQNKSFFIKGFTFEQEKAVAPALASYLLRADGDYADLLNNAVDTELNSESVQVFGYYNDNVRMRAFIESLPFCEKSLSTYRKRYGDRIRYLWVSEEFITLEVTQGYYPKQDLLLDFRPQKHFGYYLLDAASGMTLPDVNLAKGLQGEYISKTECERRGYAIDGLPVVMYTYVKEKLNRARELYVDTSTELYYSIVDVHYTSEKNVDGEFCTDTLAPLIDTGSQLRVHNFDKSFKSVGAVDFEDYKSKILDSVDTNLSFKDKDANEASYRDTVNKLIFNYIVAQAMYDDTEFVSIDGLTDDYLIRADADAHRHMPMVWKPHEI